MNTSSMPTSSSTPTREGDLTNKESRLVTVLTLSCRSSDWPMSMVVPSKSTDAFCLASAARFINNLGWDKVTIQGDGEPAMKDFLKKMQLLLGADKVSVRHTPSYSHQSAGHAENMNGQCAAMVRTWISQLADRYPQAVVDSNCNLFGWLVRHASWLLARYHVRRDKLTPHKVIKGFDYKDELCSFGETVLGKLANVDQIPKYKPRWIRGIWVGRSEVDNTHIMLTTQGVENVRTVRRLPSSSQFCMETMESVVGLPWAPREGAVRAEPERSNVEVIPIPVGIGNSGSPEEIADGPANADGAASPDSSSSSEANMSGAKTPSAESASAASPNQGEATIEADVPMRDAPLPQTPERRTNAGTFASPPVFRGSGGSPLSSLPAVPQMPYGVNPIRRPVFEAEGSPGKYARIATVNDMWSECARIAESDEDCVAAIYSIVEYLDHWIEEDELHEARMVELDKLNLDFSAFTPVCRRRLPRDITIKRHKWVDVKKKGAVKSRLTCADVKRRGVEATGETFCPTPQSASLRILEAIALHYGWPTRSADVVCISDCSRTRRCGWSAHLHVSSCRV